MKVTVPGSAPTVVFFMVPMSSFVSLQRTQLSWPVYGCVFPYCVRPFSSTRVEVVEPCSCGWQVLCSFGLVLVRHQGL